MKRFFAASAVVLALGTASVSAAEPSSGLKLTDGQLDDVVAGDPIIDVDVNALLDLDVLITDINVDVDVDIPIALVVQTNVLGNATFDAIAVGVQNNFNAAFPSG
jgi:hypothetical protein